MKWGIVVEWDVSGLTCCGWMQRTDEDTLDDAREFDSEADAAQFIRQLPAMPEEIAYDRILTPQEFSS